MKKICVIGLLLLAAWLACGMDTNYVSPTSRQEVIYLHTVSPGDTFWDIAKLYYNGGQSFNEFVFQICYENGYTNTNRTLVPGEIIMIKVKK